MPASAVGLDFAACGALVSCACAEATKRAMSEAIQNVFMAVSCEKSMKAAAERRSTLLQFLARLINTIRASLINQEFETHITARTPILCGGVRLREGMETC